MSLATGTLRSEPDYAIRYAILRLCALARGKDPLAERAARLRLVFSGKDEGSLLAWPEVVIESSEGRVLEQVLCQGYHEIFLPPDALHRFLERTRWSRSRSPEADTRYRWVTNVRLLKLPPEERIWDLADPRERREVLVRTSLESLDGEHVIWEMGCHSLNHLTAESLFYLSQDNPSRDDRKTYQDIYESLRALVEKELSSRERKLEQNLLLYLYGELVSKEPEFLPAPGEVAFWRQNLLSSPASDRASLPIDAERISFSLRRGLFPETEVTLEEIYVPQKARLTIPDEEKKRSLLRTGEAHELLFWWLAEARRRIQLPLLVLGSFGSGKSSLLTVFARRLIEAESPMIPILVPLRDLRGASTAQPLKQVLVEHVRRSWNVDLDVSSPGRRYCLLCDGFDELNLYYLAVASEQWVSECFRSLCLLAERADIDMVISSRPILLMDITRSEYEGGDCTRLDLELFDRPEIDQWCVNYRRAAELEDFLSADQLEERDLFEVARTPLILYMMARLYEFEETAFSEPRRYTRAEIYRRFVDWTQTGGYREDKEKHRLPRNYRLILQDIGRYFFQEGDGFVAEEPLLESLRATYGAKLDRVPIDRNILVAHMFQPVEEPGENDRRLIEFTHQSFREYLMAEWVWERLAAARSGQGLDAGLWGGLSHKYIPSNEVRFLADMISELLWEEAFELYQALAETENVHSYWTKYFHPFLNKLSSDLKAEAVNEVETKVHTALTRSCNLATLGFLLRSKCYTRLGELARSGSDRKLPDPLPAEVLSRLLHLLKTLPNSGVGGNNLSVLMANLQGLILGGTALEGHQLDHPVLRDSQLQGINFSGSRWLEADLRGADLSEASFNNCLLTLSAADGATFQGAKFSDAIITHPERKRIVGADFYEADFHRARFLDLTLVESRFVNNRWDGASRLYSRENRPNVLIRCEIDEAAERFFTKQGFCLDKCIRTGPPRRESSCRTA